jgi:hypothetical protein
MLSTFPAAWLVLALPFTSAAVIAHVRPLRELTASYHRITWTVGVVGLCAFAAALVGLVPTAWTVPAVFAGGAVAGFSCFWTKKPDDGDDDWRRWTQPADDHGPPGPPGVRIDWQQFDRLRSQWARQARVRR